MQRTLRLFLTNSYVILHRGLRRKGRADKPISGSEDRRCSSAGMKNNLSIKGD
jgi:hypothetical protein